MPQFEKRRFRPSRLLARLELAHGWLFQAIDQHRRLNASADRKRARSQYLTSWDAGTILDEANEVVVDEEVGRLSAAHIAGLAAWRMTKGIYRFDVGFLSHLSRTPVHPGIQGSVLTRLPQWCVYVEADTFIASRGIHGFWAFAEQSEVLQRRTLHLLLDEPSCVRHVPLSLNSTLSAGMELAVCEDSEQSAGAQCEGKVIASPISEKWPGVIEAASTMVTYLCCTNADIGERGQYPRNPNAVRVASRWTLFPADGTSVWRVGQSAASHMAEVSGSSGSHAAAPLPRFDVQDVVRNGDVPDQDVMWMG